MNWTKAQLETIETRGKNILVSAAAGSGKTAVLVERIKQLIIGDKVDVDRFLITTFTNAASMEMKERLEKAIKDELEKPETSKEDRLFLRKQLNLIGRANISTFHSFALEVMKRYFYLTDLEPTFRIGDDVQVSILKNESADELFEKRFEDDYNSFKEFLKKYSSDRNENRIKRNIISLYDELRSVPFYLDWAKERTELLATASPSEALGLTAFIENELREDLKQAALFYDKAARLLDESGIDSLYEKAREDADRVERAASAQNMDSLAGFINNPNFNQMRAAKAQQADYEKVKAYVSDYRKKGKKLIDDLGKRYFRRSRQEYDDELRQLYDDTKYLVGLIEEFEIIFRLKKSERNMVDFDDVMHYALNILEDETAASEYRDRFRYIFIDEFQDSNMLQELIASRICRDDNMFMVGDVKQSIYKFRLAEPEIFKRKYVLYSKKDQIKSCKIDLNNNFRSKYNVTKTVNEIFREVMKDYDENAELHCSVGMNNTGNISSLNVIDKCGINDDGRENSQLEAAMTASLIKECVGRPFYDTKRQHIRNVEYSDIVVLSRSRSTISGLERYLNNEGIPAYGEELGGYFESVEIEVFVNLLRVIDNMRRDIPLLSVMRSAIFDFDVRELAEIRKTFSEGSFYNAVSSYDKSGSDEELREKIHDMLEKLNFWKEMSRAVTLEELTHTLIHDTGYYDYCSGLPMGKKRISNLRILTERAAAFEENNYSGLYGFISYIDAMRKNNISVPEAKTAGDGENAVRIMTVHKSKGLEFPIVILTGAGRMIKAKGSGASAVMHKDFGIGMTYVNRQECWHRKTLLQRVIESKKSKEELEEEVRILYVALTRAMDELMIIGTVKDASELDAELPGKKSYLDMIYAPMNRAGDRIIIRAAEQLDDVEPYKGRRRDIDDLFVYCEEAEDKEIQRQIDERFSFVYPYENLAGVKSKYSVTELNKKAAEERVGGTYRSAEAVIPSLQIPGFADKERKLNAAERGTAIHLVMDKIDFKKAVEYGEEYIRSVADELCMRKVLSQEERMAVNAARIYEFFESDMGRRAAAAEKLYKEREFLMLKEIGGAETIVQGVIDCYFEEEDGIVLIDYKNTYVSKDRSEEDILEEYRGQLDLYKEALEAALHKKIKEAYLYLFNLGKFIKCG